MIVKRELNSELKLFSEIEIGACFEIPVGIDYETGAPRLASDPTCYYIKTEWMRWFDEWGQICRVTNAIDLKTGQSMHIADDRWVIERKNATLIIN